MPERTFTDKPAVRESVPLLVGLMGASGSGKTYSALRIATGMQKVTGGDIYAIDTESRRMLHYADGFNFRHVELTAPFSPLDYLAAIEHCVKQKAGVLIVDSMSHEHEGPGGVLEWHDKEMGGNFKKQFTAWAKPKAARRRLINTVLQLGVNAVFCFRAKEKIKVPAQKGADVIQLGWMPIAGDEFLYEQTVNFLLYPNSGGVPTWQTDQPGENMMMKLPRQFESLLKPPKQLNEDTGRELAEWSAGGYTPAVAADDPTDGDAEILIAAIMDAADKKEVEQMASDSRDTNWSNSQRSAIRGAIKQRSEEFAAA